MSKVKLYTIPVETIRALVAEQMKEILGRRYVPARLL